MHLHALGLPWEHAAFPAGAASKHDALVQCVSNPSVHASFTLTVLLKGVVGTRWLLHCFPVNLTLYLLFSSATRMAHSLTQVVVALALAISWCAPGIASAAKRDSRPNIVMILVDDQDFHLGSMDHMFSLQSQLVQQGVMFTNHYGHVSQCCPARATLWTGKHAHNTNVTSVLNGQPGGAWRQIQAKGWYKKYIPVWMQQAGYLTYYSGKIFNGYGTRSYCDPVCLEGWTRVSKSMGKRVARTT